MNKMALNIIKIKEMILDVRRYSDDPELIIHVEGEKRVPMFKFLCTTVSRGLTLSANATAKSLQRLEFLRLFHKNELDRNLLVTVCRSSPAAQLQTERPFRQLSNQRRRSLVFSYLYSKTSAS